MKMIKKLFRRLKMKTNRFWRSWRRTDEARENQDDSFKTTDWKFDFSTLPYWDNRDSVPWFYDKFYEIPQSDALCCIYSIIEASMCNYIGFLAILKNKAEPKLFLNITHGINFSDNFSVNEKGNLIFLRAQIYDKATNKAECPVLIIDIEKSLFSYLVTVNYNPCYKIIELGDGVFGVEADNYQKKNDRRLSIFSKQKIDTKCLEWHKLDDIGLLHKMIF